MEDTKLLGEKPVSKLLLKFSVPCVLALLIGAFYNIVDQIFIGHSRLGYLGNAATGISFPIICIANAIAWCIGDGAAAYLSICAGRQDSESAHKCVGTGISSTFIFSLILTAVSLIFCKPLMTLFGASDATLEMACDYFTILAIFFPAYNLMGAMNSMIRADGSPGYAMMALSVGAFLNIILDPICIFILDWGIKGAAIATVFGQIISCLICFLYFRKPKSFKLSKRSFKINMPMLQNLIIMGGSTFIIQVAIVIMNLLCNVMLFKFGSLSIYGSDIPISVFSIQTKVFTIVTNIAVGITLGGQPILGYNYGAGKMDRVRQTYKLIFLASVSVGVVASLIFIIRPQLIISLFGKQNELYMDFAVKSFRIFLSLIFVTCFIKLSAIFFQSIGKPVQSMLTSLIRDLFCFVIFTIVLCNVFEKASPGNGIYGILIASPLSDIVSGTIIGILTIKFFKSTKAQEETKKTVSSTEEISQKVSPTVPGTIITIARQHGTCGKEIGQLVAKKLGVPFYCKELTAIAAKETGLSEEFLEKDFDIPTETFNQLSLSSNVVQHGIFAQEQIIKKIADEGACVIVGRSADYVLRNYPNVVNIFLYAPETYRAQNIQKTHKNTFAEACQYINNSDQSRANYYKNTTGQLWQNMENYDLCLNSVIGIEKTADIIVDYVN